MSDSRWGPRPGDSRREGGRRRPDKDDNNYRGREREEPQRRRDRSRSRSRSPEEEDRRRAGTSASASASASGAAINNSGGRPEELDRRRQEDDRKARMARLRMENEEEERRLVADVEDNEQGGSRKRAPDPTKEIVEVQESELEGLDEEEQMKKLLGFGDFGTTAGQKVEDNHSGAARGAAAKNKARKYRQYMNRKNGFNRPLEKMD